MKETALMTMRENLTKLDAKDLYYYQWVSGDLYTVVATDGEKHGEAITIGYVSNISVLEKLELPMYNSCPFN